MREIIITSFIFLFIINDIFNQIVDIPINKITPKWKLLSYNEQSTQNFEDGLYINTYFFPENEIRIDTNLFLLSHCLMPNGGDFGYCVEKLNINTGEKLWKKCNSLYSVSTNNRQEYIYKMYYDERNNTIVLTGVSRDTIGKDIVHNFWPYEFDGNIMSIILDANTGEIIDEIIGVSINNFYDFCNVYQSNNSNSYLFVKPIFNNDSLQSYSIILLDKNLERIDSLAIRSTTSNTNREVSLSFQKNDSTFVILFINNKYYYPDHDYSLVEFVVDSDLTIRDRRNINISNFISPKSNNTNSLNLEFLNENFVYSDRILNDSINQFASFLVWFDKDYNLNAKIDLIRNNNHYYSTIRFMGIHDDVLYIAAKPAANGFPGFDILRIKKGESEATFLKNITSLDKNIDFSYALRLTKLYDDGKLIFTSQGKIGATLNNERWNLVHFNRW